MSHSAKTAPLVKGKALLPKATPALRVDKRLAQLRKYRALLAEMDRRGVDEIRHGQGMFSTIEEIVHAMAEPDRRSVSMRAAWERRKAKLEAVKGKAK
jgi:hypothetical protein